VSLKNTATDWGWLSKLFHWLIVLLILGQGSVGLWMVTLRNSPDKIQLFALHKSFGLTILALALLRLAWRLYSGVPRRVPGMPRWQERAADLSHWGLYALLFAIPISGWVLNSAAGFPLQWFGLFNLPRIAGKDEGLHDLAVEVHEWLFWVLVTLALLHAAAAFYHHLFQRDATLARMLPRGWLRLEQPPAPIEDSRNA
jgi:cytochrome b561